MRTLTRVLALGAIAFALTVPRTGEAAPSDADRDRASMLYRRGIKAHDRKDFAAAARDFAEADAVAPNPVALGAALDAAVDADDPVLGAELLERADARGPATGDLVKSVTAARTKLGGRAGKLRAVCPSGVSCAATLDGVAVTPGSWTHARAGAHTVVFVVDGRREPRQVQVNPDESVDVTASSVTPTAPAVVTPTPAAATPAAPQPAPTAAPEAPTKDANAKKKGLPPVMFWIAAGGTLALGGGAIAGGLVTKSKHGEFVTAGCPQITSADCSDKQRSGEGLQTITNVLIVGAGVGAVVTAVLGLWLVDWGKADKNPSASSRAPTLSVTWLPGGAAAGVGARF